MTFIDEDQIISLEVLDRDADTGTLFLFNQFGDLDDANSVPTNCLQTAILQVEPGARNSDLLHVLYVLLREFFVRSYEKDIVERLLVVVKKLAIIEMHEDGLPA